MMMVTGGDVRALAKDAFVYGYSFGGELQDALQASGRSREFGLPRSVHEIASAADIATPADTWVVTPNSDTPYSFLWMDLRAEPLVISMPKI